MFSGRLSETVGTQPWSCRRVLGQIRRHIDSPGHGGPKLCGHVRGKPGKVVREGGVEAEARTRRAGGVGVCAVIAIWLGVLDTQAGSDTAF